MSLYSTHPAPPRQNLPDSARPCLNRHTLTRLSITYLNRQTDTYRVLPKRNTPDPSTTRRNRHDTPRLTSPNLNSKDHNRLAKTDRDSPQYPFQNQTDLNRLVIPALPIHNRDPRKEAAPAAPNQFLYAARRNLSSCINSINSAV